MQQPTDSEDDEDDLYKIAVVPFLLLVMKVSLNIHCTCIINL